MLKLKSMKMLHLDSTNGQRGTEFLVHKDWVGKINEFTGINERISILKIQLQKKTQLTIVWVNAPTALSLEEESYQFYKELSQIIIEEYKRRFQDCFMILGDFNSQEGQRNNDENKNKGKYRVIHLKCLKRQALRRVKDAFNPPTKFTMWLGRHREIHGYFFSSTGSVLNEIRNIKDEKWFGQYVSAFSFWKNIWNLTEMLSCYW